MCEATVMPTVYYRTEDPVENLKIRVVIREVTDTTGHFLARRTVLYVHCRLQEAVTVSHRILEFRVQDCDNTPRIMQHSGL